MGRHRLQPRDGGGDHVGRDRLRVDAGMPPDYRRIFERMQVFERDRRQAAPLLEDADPQEDPVARSLVDGVLQHQDGVISVRAERLAGLHAGGVQDLEFDAHDFY